MPSIWDWWTPAELPGAVHDDAWQYLQDRSSPANSERSKLYSSFFSLMPPWCFPDYPCFLRWSIFKTGGTRVGKTWEGLRKISLLKTVSENNNRLMFLRSSGPLLTSAVCLLYLLQGIFSQSESFLQSHWYRKEMSCDKMTTSVQRCAWSFVVPAPWLCSQPCLFRFI